MLQQRLEVAEIQLRDKEHQQLNVEEK